MALLASPDGGALLRVIAGELAGHTGPGSTYTPMTMVHVTLSPGAQLTLPWRPTTTRSLYVLSGAAPWAPEQHPVRTGQLAVFGAGDALVVARLAAARRAAARTSTCCSAADRSASRSPGWDRSS